MAGKTAVTLRLGIEGDEKIQAALRKIGQTGDQAFAGLSKEAKTAARDFDRLEKSLDAQARSAAQVASTYVRANPAVAAGVRTQQDAQRVLDLAAERHRRLTGAVNDNAKAAGLARHEWINLSRQFQDVGVSLAGGQAPLTVLLQQGSQIADVFGSSRAGAAGALRSFGAGAARALASPIGVAAGLAAAVFGVKVAGDAAAESLAKLGEEARQTGLTPNRVAGAKIVGARAGLDDKGTIGAFINAQEEFEAFSRNSGAVKDSLEKIDKGFLNIADRARNAGEWIDRIVEKIRELPRAQGLNLAQALFGQDEGRKLFDEIQRGSVSMASLSEEASKAGANFDGAAEHAERMKRQIAEADQIASTKLAATFAGLSNVSLDIDLSWARIKSRIAGMADEIAELVRKTQQIGAVADARRTLAPMLQEEPPEAVAMRQLGLLPKGVAKSAAASFATNPNFYADKNKYFPQLLSPTVGDMRKLFESTGSGKGASKSAAEKSGEKFTEIEASLKNQIALVAAQGAEHDKIALKIKIENEQHKLGTKATQEQKDAVAGLVTRLDEATREAKLYKDIMDEANATTKDALKGLISDLREGNSLSKSLKNELGDIGNKLLNKGIDTGVDSIFNALKGGGSGGGFGAGNIISSLASLFGGSGGAAGAASGIGSTLATIATTALSVIGLENGGVMTSRGPLPLRRYAGGGVADSPQLTLFGEGRMPEAYVPLPDGRSIPVAMRGQSPNVTVHNYAAGVEVTPRMTPQGVALIVQEVSGKMIDANNRQMSSILADQRRRSR